MKKGLVLLLGSIALVGCANKDTSVKQEVFTVEYGDKISKDPNDYLQGSNVDDYKIKIEGIDQYQKILKAHPPVEEYKAEAVNGKKKLSFKIKIKDSHKPKVDKTKIKLAQGSNEEDVRTSLTPHIYDVVGKDKVNCANFDIKGLKDINFDKPGHYDVEVIAKDANGLETKQTVNVEIEKVINNMVCRDPYEHDDNRKIEYNAKKQQVTYVTYIDKNSQQGKDLKKMGIKEYIKDREDALNKNDSHVKVSVKETDNKYIVSEVDPNEKVTKKDFVAMMNGHLDKCKEK